MFQCTNYNGHLNVSYRKIKEYRLRNNLSLSGLSIKLALLGIDIPKQSIYKLETGERIIKDFELYALSYIFKVHMEDLLEDFAQDLTEEKLFKKSDKFRI